MEGPVPFRTPAAGVFADADMPTGLNLLRFPLDTAVGLTADRPVGEASLISCFQGRLAMPAAPRRRARRLDWLLFEATRRGRYRELALKNESVEPLRLHHEVATRVCTKL